MQMPLGGLRPQLAQAAATPVPAGFSRPFPSSANAAGLRQRQPQRRSCAAPRVAVRDGLGDVAESDARADEAEAADYQAVQAEQPDEEELEEYEMVPAMPVGFTDEELEEIANQPSPNPSTQQTLVKSFVVEGFTQHSDVDAIVRVMPAFAGEGRYFVRVPDGSIPRLQQEEQPDKAESAAQSDEEKEKEPAAPKPEEVVPMGEDEACIPATFGHAVLQPAHCLFPTLLRGEHRVMAADGLLAALEACGVDNARIELEGNGELPAYDGSAAGWAQEIRHAGVRQAPRSSGGGSPVPTQRLAPHKVVLVREGEAFISLVPAAAARLSVGIDQSAAAPVIGAQWATWAPSDREQHHFRWAVAPARHCFTSPQERLDRLAQGFFKADEGDLTAVADGYSWQAPEELRYGWDEPARRRLLELTADLSLLSVGGRGGIPAGHITAWNASRGLQLKFLRALLTVCGESPDE